MIQNKLFRDCLAAIPAEQKAEFDLSFGIAERISEILKAKGLPKGFRPLTQQARLRNLEMANRQT